MGGFPCAETPSTYWDSPQRTPTQGEEEETKKHEYWRAKFEEGAREMQAIEGSKLRRLQDTDLQAWIELLNRRVDMEEARSCGSHLHVKLLQDYEEAVNAKSVQDMQTSTAICMETIARLESELKLYKVELSKQ